MLCGSHISDDGTVTPEPLLDLATSGSQTWHAVRGALVAPVSGLALLTTSAIGMAQCSGPPLLVGFWPAERADSGSIVGDLFVTRQLDADGPAGFFQEGGRGTGVPFIRYGPNLPITRAAEERLGLHEERHVDQWAVATAAAGPAAFPVAYFADYIVFPYARSHFERAASLEDGDYPIPPDFGPAPLWGPILGVALVAALLLRSRLVLAFRLARGREVVVQPDRCRLHTSGAWRRASARAALRAR